jgi:hypothetical protein
MEFWSTLWVALLWLSSGAFFLVTVFIVLRGARRLLG